MVHDKRKRLGQHFLVDREVVKRIVDAADVGPGDKVYEVGPGRGILTKELLATGVSLYSVEVDRDLYEGLKKELAGNENLRLVRDNALQIDLDRLPGPYKVVSNLPYAVAVPLIRRFIERSGGNILSMILMTQEEVARRVVADAGDTHYGSLSIYLAYHCQRDYLFTVGPEKFNPPPQVDSAVVRLTPLTKPPVEVDDPPRFFDFVKLSFMHRRKTLKNNLVLHWGGEVDIEDALERSGIAPNARPQEIDIATFARLYAFWEEKFE